MRGATTGASSALEVTWLDRSGASARCPVCGDTAEHDREFRYRWLGGQPREVIRCSACASRFLDDLTPPPDAPADPDAIRFYVEQGAGLDIMIEPVFRAAAAGARSMIDVGCGFGLALDFARRAMGWEVGGFDPSAVAAAGRDLLGLPISTAPLSEDADGRRADLILASEVIEHVPDPPALLRTARAHLSDRGLLALTTPDGERLVVDGEIAIPALSPYHHVVLFTVTSLRRALAAAGFTAIDVRSRAGTLVAYAATDSGVLRTALQAEPLDVDVYLAYLDGRVRDPASDAVARGMAYRHLKTCVNGARYNDATRSFARLRDLYMTTAGIDVGRPAELAAISDGAGMPFNTQGVLYLLGMLELNHRQDHRAAAEAFAASAAVARAQRQLPDGGGATPVVSCLAATDGENRDLHRLAVEHRLYALAHFDPARAATDALLHHALEPHDDEHLRLPGLAGLFLRLGTLGALDDAERLAPALRALSADEAALGPGLAAKVRLGFGLLALHRHDDPSTAVVHLEDAARMARSALGSDPDGESHLPEVYWQTRCHQAVALARMGQAERGSTVLAEVIDGHGEVPPAAGVHRDMALRIRKDLRAC